MTDYIKKDDVLDIAIKARVPMDIREEEPDVAWVRGFNGALNSVYHLPAADVRPVVRGKWVKIHPKSRLDGEFYCPACRDVIDIATGKETPLDRGLNFCPNCGADMREWEAE